VEPKTLETQLAELKAGLETFSKEEIKAGLSKIEEQIKAIADKADKGELEKLNTSVAEIKTAMAKNQEWIDEQIVNGKRKKAGNPEAKSFNEILADTIKRNASTIANFRRNNPELRFDLLPEGEKDSEGKALEVKAVGDMSIAANFPGATGLYQDVRGPLIMTPYERQWIADLLPQGTSTGTQVAYPKENGIDGGAAAWTDQTQNKPQVDFNFIPMTAPFTWIAGYAVVQRDMIDDIPWMTSYLQNRLLVSLKTAENDFVINGVGAIPGLEDVAVVYNGSYKNPVDKLIDAAYGQIPAGTSEFYYPTNAIINTRDVVTLGLNKASGSGEYDLPLGSVTFVNGGLSIGGLKVTGTTSARWGTFYVLDNRATMFIRRLQPELRMFEDATLAKKNQIMFRIEERAALIIFNNSAIVKGVLANS
jgi:HK97 family phage major capsid protein